MNHRPDGRLPLLSARPAVTHATLKRAATNFAAWWTEAQWVWTVCLRLLPDSIASGNTRTRPATLHTHTHTFNGPLSGPTRVSRYQKGITNLDFAEARDSEWQWHQLDHMQVCTSLQTDNHATTPPLSFFTGQMPLLLPNQQCQSPEGNDQLHYLVH